MVRIPIARAHHSERDRIKSIEEIQMAELTPLGKKAAYEFGLNLPKNRTYRIYHSPYLRNQQTAEKIHEGTKMLGTKTEFMGLENYIFSQSTRMRARIPSKT